MMQKQSRIMTGGCKSFYSDAETETLNKMQEESETDIAWSSLYRHVLSAEGLKADSCKAEAIGDMPAPVDVKGVQCLIGMIMVLAKFCPHLTTMAKLIQQLSRQNVVWERSDTQQQPFSLVKQMIMNAPVWWGSNWHFSVMHLRKA